ncbi:serine/threonine-protein kinase [Nocardia concava]|uniref:serine/threonine-protein kinase n=1 Tax=Nocardia concava TaxID=257281 RepID=UPI001FDED069|nr:serine/threonine-protein kinase [Nocardia concava]
MAGTLFAGYRIERVLGRGGMGTVYLVKHPRLPRFEALKVLPADFGKDYEYRARFAREAEIAARLDHPNIVAVRDRGETDGCLWIAMQFVDGSDAAALVGRYPGGLPPARAQHILEQAAHGLDEAHRAGMLHRDIKPANLMLESRPDGLDRVYVSDFGIARVIAKSTELTEAGAVMATVAYASPEQLSAAVLDHRADVYALGGTLYELLTGAKPFPRANVAAVMQAHLMEPPPRPSAVNPALPAAIDAVIARAMAKRPADRYSSCGELARAAAHALGSSGAPTQTTTATARLRPRRTVTLRGLRTNLAGGQPGTRPRGRRALVGAVGAAALLVIAGIVALTHDWNESGSIGAPSSLTLTPSAPTSTTGSPVAWGAYQFVAQAFPNLLPAAPIASGYQGLRCEPIDQEGDRLTLTQPLGTIAFLRCGGNKSPVTMLVAACRVNRAPRELPDIETDITLLRNEPWDRPTGHGVVRAYTAGAYGGGTEGFLLIHFDDPARNFCSITVTGGTTGNDLFDGWWRDAPL